VGGNKWVGPEENAPPGLGPVSKARTEKGQRGKLVCQKRRWRRFGRPTRTNRPKRGVFDPKKKKKQRNTQVRCRGERKGKQKMSKMKLVRAPAGRGAGGEGRGMPSERNGGGKKGAGAPKKTDCDYQGG